MHHYVYKFLNDNNKVIYIGKTENINKRVHHQHFTIGGHLDKQAYLETKQVYYSELISHEEMDIYERYLINILNPKYNTQMKNNNKFRFELPELTWNRIDFNKEKLIKQIKLEELKNERMVNIEAELNEVTKQGYLLLYNQNTQVLNLKLKRKFAGTKTEINFDKQNPYCRYILVNCKKYFCINDIESALDSLDTSSRTSRLIKNNNIECKDILILDDETLKGSHIRCGQKLRLGSEKWLKNRILQQVELNKHQSGSKCYETGWTKDLEYLYYKVLDNSKSS